MYLCIYLDHAIFYQNVKKNSGETITSVFLVKLSGLIHLSLTLCQLVFIWLHFWVWPPYLKNQWTTNAQNQIPTLHHLVIRWIEVKWLKMLLLLFHCIAHLTAMYCILILCYRVVCSISAHFFRRIVSSEIFWGEKWTLYVLQTPSVFQIKFPETPK